MSTVSALLSAVLEQIVMLKSMIPDLGWFDGDQMKFENWWREIHLFLKSNKITATNNKITIVLAQLRKGIIRIYIQKKIDQIEEEDNIQDWNEFIKKVRTVFSDKSKVAF